MTCYHPLLAEKITTFSQSFDPSGKKTKKVRILGQAENLLDIKDCSNLVSKFFTVPCGKCIGCRIDRARDWSVRIMCEASMCERSSWFLTLTYDEDHMDSLSLDKFHFQNFIKDLRNYLNYKFNYSVRYFGCGEYGDSSGRRHLHIILFNLGDLDITPRTAKNGYIYYESKILSDIWSKGHVVIAALNIQTASYVAKYTLKKQGLKSYEDLGVQSPFILMSTRPGIGYDYLIKNQYDLLKKPYIFMNNKNYPMPRYFKRVLEEKFSINPNVFNDEIIEKMYYINLTKELYLKKDLKHILEAEELNLLASQKKRLL